MRKYQLVVIFIFIIFALLTFVLLLKDPPAWPDEALLADVAGNVAEKGRLGTDYGSVIPNMKNHAYWYPPVYFYLLAFWFKLFGLSLLGQRVLSIAVSLGFLIIFYFFSKLIFESKSRWLPVLTLGSLVVDFTFARSTRVGRPEIFVLFFGLLALYCFFRALDRNNKERLKDVSFVLSGLLTSFALLTHLLGSFFFILIVSYWFLVKKLRIFKSESFYLFILAFVVPVAIWLVSIFPYWHLLKNQVLLVQAVKKTVAPWFLILLALPNQSLSLKLVYLGYFWTTFLFLVFSLILKKRKYWLVSLALTVTWFVSVYGKTFWYSVYFTPFVYLALFLVWPEVAKKTTWFKLAWGIALMLLFLNLKLQVDSLWLSRGNNYSYEELAKQVLLIVPEGKTVFISSIPDLYYGFKEQERKNRLYQFPMTHTKRGNYLRVLNESDFIVYSGSYEEFIFGDLLERYIEENKLRVDEIGSYDQYRISVIELKSKDQRIIPEPLDE